MSNIEAELSVSAKEMATATILHVGLMREMTEKALAAGYAEEAVVKQMIGHLNAALDSGFKLIGTGELPDISLDELVGAISAMIEFRAILENDLKSSPLPISLH